MSHGIKILGKSVYPRKLRWCPSDEVFIAMVTLQNEISEKVNMEEQS
jgi:hypothetical protein